MTGTRPRRKKDLGGRPPLYQEPLQQTSVMLRRDQLRWLRRQGRGQGGKIIRDALDRIIERVPSKDGVETTKERESL